MKWASAISTQPSLEAAIRELIQQTKAQLGVEPDLAFVFISLAFTSEYSRLLPLLQEHLPTARIIGCSGGGAIGMLNGNPEEIEEGPAISLTLAHLPGVEIKPFHLTDVDLPDLDSPPREWCDLIGVAPERQPSFVIMADPFSSGTSELLQGIDFAYPGTVKVGGLAGVESFNRRGGLFCEQRVYSEGIVGVALSGNIVLEAIVAQGCRPIGKLYRVSEGDRNILIKLTEDELGDELGDEAAGETPLEVLQGIFQNLSEKDRELAQNALFIGVAQSGFKPDLTRRDFLIRNLVGVDPRNGSIAIADRIRPGMRIHFHMRDAATSAEDLESLLRRYRMERLESKLLSKPSEPPPPASARESQDEGQDESQDRGEAEARAFPDETPKEGGNHARADASRQRAIPKGALLFACTGRGLDLYDESNFDSNLFEKYLGPLPIGGLFCNGEIGPVGSTTFLHGFTSVFGIFGQPE